MSSIHDLGYDDFFQVGFENFRTKSESARRDRSSPARVLRQDRETWLVSDGEAEFSARLSGRLRRSSDSLEVNPAVGDWVAVEHHGGAARLAAILPRKSLILRKAAGNATQAQAIAANVDFALIVAALDSDFNPRRIERYLAAVSDSGALPVVVLSKLDLVEDVERCVERVRVAAEVPIVPLSAVTGDGFQRLRELLSPRSTSVLIGSSGVGKSTLLNLLLGEERQATESVRPGDERGRHTTTRRELLALPWGALVIDTPGMRELLPWLDETGLDVAFGDIEALAGDCRFRDCTHQTEPGCALRAAVERGLFDADRLQNYHKQQREVRWLTERRDDLARRRETSQKKSIARFARSLKKRGGKWS